MSSIQHVYRGPSRALSTHRLSRLVLAGTAALLLFATAAPSWAKSPPSPAEIVSAVAVDTSLLVEVVTDPGLDATTTFVLRYVAWDGTEVDAAFFQPLASVQKLTLDGDFSALATRGWQHRLEIVDLDGGGVDLLHLRLGLECKDEVSPCQVVARPGVRMDHAVAVSETLALHLAAEESVDLSLLANAEPALRAAIFEAAVDLETRGQESVAGYRCAYLFSRNDHLATGQTRKLQLNFRCFEMDAFIALPILTSVGVLRTNGPILMPASGADPCPPTVITIVLGPEEGEEVVP